MTIFEPSLSLHLILLYLYLYFSIIQLQPVPCPFHHPRTPLQPSFPLLSSSLVVRAFNGMDTLVPTMVNVSTIILLVLTLGPSTLFATNVNARDRDREIAVPTDLGIVITRGIVVEAHLLIADTVVADMAAVAVVITIAAAAAAVVVMDVAAMVVATIAGATIAAAAAAVVVVVVVATIAGTTTAAAAAAAMSIAAAGLINVAAAAAAVASTGVGMVAAAAGMINGVAVAAVLVAVDGVLILTRLYRLASTETPRRLLRATAIDGAGAARIFMSGLILNHSCCPSPNLPSLPGQLASSSNLPRTLHDVSQQSTTAVR